MAQRKVRPMSPTEMNNALTLQLVSVGYSQAQARTLLGYATRMARQEDVTIQSARWLRDGDLDMAARALLRHRERPSRGRQILEGLEFSGPIALTSQREMESLLRTRLVKSGYSAEQAGIIVREAGRSARATGARRAVGPYPWLEQGDLDGATRVLNRALNDPAQAPEIIDRAMFRGPRGGVLVRARPIRTIRVYAHEVTVGGRTYEVVSSRRIPGAGVRTLATGRLSHLRALLARRDPSIFPRSGTPEEREQYGVFLVSSTGRRTRLEGERLSGFVQVYNRAYLAMVRQENSTGRYVELASVSSGVRREIEIRSRTRATGG